MRDAHRDGALLALKVLRREEGSGPPRDRQALAGEFLALARLAHPCIARVRDFGFLEDGTAFFTSDLARGSDILTHCLTHPFQSDWPAFHSLAAQALGALHAVHSAGLVHGDVKPAHLIVEEVPGGGAPRLTLIDLGSARPVSDLAPGEALRTTPAYLPPVGLGFGPEADLHALGMSLFHALVGRLPFSLGEPQSLAAWRNAGRPAIPGEWTSDVPPAVDELVRGLTAGPAHPSARRFRSAREALEQLERRTAAARLPRLETSARCRLTGREAEMEMIFSEITSPAAPLLVMGGAPGMGKSRLCEEAVRRIQVLGWETVLVDPAGSSRELARLAGEASPLSARALPASPEELGVAILEDLGSRPVLVVLDGILDPPSGKGGPGSEGPEPRSSLAWSAFARKYLEQAPGKVRLLIATARADLLRRRWGPSPRWRELALGPLRRGALRDLLVDRFRTTAIPDEIVERLATESGGRPCEALRVLSELTRSARLDPLGMLRIDPPRSSAANARGPAAEVLPAPHRLALAIVSMTPRPIDASRVAACARGLEAGPDATSWEEVLEELHWRGLLARPDPALELFTPAIPSDAEAGGGIDPDVVRRIRRRVLEDLIIDAPLPGTRDPGLLAALSRAALGAGEHTLALRSARWAVHRFRAGRRAGEGAAFLDELLDRLEASGQSGCAYHVLLLRQAELMILDGRRRRAERTVERLSRHTGDATFPPGLRARGLIALSILEEGLGRLPSAASRLEAALSILETIAPGGHPRSRFYEASARLAALRFRAGRTDEGRALLPRGEDLAHRVEEHLARPGRVPSGSLEDPSVHAEALARFGLLTLRHGEPGRAVWLLERSLELARSAGREDLRAAPLHELALYLAGRSRYAEAEEALSECERILEGAADRLSLLRVKVNLATLHHKRGDLERAEELYRRARLLAEDLCDDKASATAWMGLEMVRRDRGDLREALRLGRAILQRFRGADPRILAAAHSNLGEIQLALGRPEVSRRHRARGLALARRCDYRLLMGFSLMGLGAARWAVGDLKGAERRLRAALAAEGTDHQLRGAVFHYLGLVAADRGNLREAMRSLGAAMLHARRAGSRSHLEAALLALVDLLLRSNRRPRAVAILSGRGWSAARSSGASPRTSVTGRSVFTAEALEARCAPGWPTQMGRFLGIVDGAESAGEVLAALRLVVDATRDAIWKGAPPQDLLARRESLAARFLRRSPGRDRSFFIGAHGGPQESSSSKLRGTGLEEVEEDPLLVLAARWATGESRTDREGKGRALDDDLGRLRSAIPVRALWVLNPPDNAEAMFHSGAESGPPLDLFSSRSSLIERASVAERTSWGPGFMILPIPGGEGRRRGAAARRVLYVELDLEQEPARAVRDRIYLAATLLAGLFRIRSAEAALQADRERLREKDEEVRRLNAILASSKGQVETAVITQRLILVETRARETARSRGEPRLPAARSQAMMDVLNRMKRVAGQDLPVLIVGEAGAGKDFLARAIHGLSKRRSGPFMSEVCSIPESLLESELFGFVRGAFTDAIEDRPGLLQLCHGGTFYLDEISEMSPGLQARLLRVLEERRARPLGASSPSPVDFRLISSTRLSFDDLARSGKVRQDLIYRLKGEVLRIPPLRERPEDIFLLVPAIAAECALEKGLPPPEVAPALLEALARCRWPGNIRQLENEVRRAILLNPARLEAEAFEELSRGSSSVPRLRDGQADAPALGPLRSARNEFERRLLIEALEAHNGNASQAARSLKVSRRYLGILLEKHGVRLAEFAPLRRGDRKVVPRREEEL